MALSHYMDNLDNTIDDAFTNLRDNIDDNLKKYLLLYIANEMKVPFFNESGNTEFKNMISREYDLEKNTYYDIRRYLQRLEGNMGRNLCFYQKNGKWKMSSSRSNFSKIDGHERYKSTLVTLREVLTTYGMGVFDNSSKNIENNKKVIKALFA
tara:strand:- start:5716 stop:6174 length:459 start_codon:yes stop_codon:yes gene_type:complete